MKIPVIPICITILLVLIQALSPTLARPAPTQMPSKIAAGDPGDSVTPATKIPTAWIEYDDSTVTPVLDNVSAHLAAARTALAHKDNERAAEAMHAAARELAIQADRAAALDRERTAADLKQARETHLRLASLSKKLDATAEAIKTGKIPTLAALDRTLGPTARADLEQRWLVTDLTTWYAVIDKPQRHFVAAREAFVEQDGKTAATEVRKAEAYVRLDAARASGEAKAELDAIKEELETTARALDQGTIEHERDLARMFARANRTLALAYRTQAAESWAQKAYEEVGYELKAAADDLESAATWIDVETGTAISAAMAETQAIGDKLASGGVWAKEEVAEGFESLDKQLHAMERLIQSPEAKGSPTDGTRN